MFDDVLIDALAMPPEMEEAINRKLEEAMQRPDSYLKAWEACSLFRYPQEICARGCWKIQIQ